MNSITADMSRTVFDVAAEHASAVDADARFPHEAVEALRQSCLLGLVTSSGGIGGIDLERAGVICRSLGRVCSSTGLIYAMHLSQLACLSAVAAVSPCYARFLQAAVAEQWLLASVTSETGVGGDIRTSSCSADIADDQFTLDKQAPTASYLEHADAILVTSRRSSNASSSDQVLVVVPAGSVHVERLKRWDTLGMRGTCSGGFHLRARGAAEQISPIPFAVLAEQVMLPVSHVLWGSVWLGIAAMSLERARAYLAAKARVSASGPLSGYLAGAALRLERATASLRTMEARLDAATRSVAQQQADAARGKERALGSVFMINGLKITLSEMATDIVLQCLQICGTEGYSNHSPYSVARQLRDVLSAPLMVNNDRIAANNAHLALVQKNLASVI